MQPDTKCKALSEYTKRMSTSAYIYCQRISRCHGSELLARAFCTETHLFHTLHYQVSMPRQVKATRLQGPTMPESLRLYHFFVPELPGPQSAYGGKHTKSAMLELCFTHPVDWQCISDAQRVEALLLTNPAFQHLLSSKSRDVVPNAKQRMTGVMSRCSILLSLIPFHNINVQTCGYRKNGTAADISISLPKGWIGLQSLNQPTVTAPHGSK